MCNVPGKADVSYLSANELVNVRPLVIINPFSGNAFLDKRQKHKSGSVDFMISFGFPWTCIIRCSYESSMPPAAEQTPWKSSRNRATSCCFRCGIHGPPFAFHPFTINLILSGLSHVLAGQDCTGLLFSFHRNQCLPQTHVINTVWGRSQHHLCTKPDFGLKHRMGRARDDPARCI